MKQSPFWRGFIIVLAAVVLFGGLIFLNRILAGDSFAKEEAQHSLYGLWLTRDILALDWSNFWYDTGRQLVWPFLHSWILSIFFLFFGASYISARALSFIFFVASIFIVYLLSDRIAKESGWKIGIIAALLMLFSPLMIKYASLNMLEGLGALLFLACAYFYIVSAERKDILHYVFLAFLIGLSIYTNYLYAYLLVPAFIVATLTDLGPILAEALRLRRRGEKAAVSFVWWAYRKMVVLLVLLVLAGAWFSFSFSRKVILFLDSIFKYSGGEAVTSFWQAILYYPGVIISKFTFSPWLGSFVLLSLFVPFVARRFKGLNKLYVFVWTVLILATLTISAKAPRMIYIIVPFVFVIFASSLVYIWEFLETKGKRLGLVLLLVIFLPVCLSLPGAFALFFPHRPAENMVQVLDYFQASVPADRTAALSFNLQNLNPEAVQFHFKGRSGKILTEDQPDGELFARGEYFMTVELDEDSLYQEGVLDDSLYRWNSWLQNKEMQGEIRLFSTRRFESIGVNAKIYQKISPRI